MVNRNKAIADLKAGYLFPEIEKRKLDFLKNYPHANLISLGIGDTTRPLCKPVVEGIKELAQAFGTIEGYKGYPTASGDEKLRLLISEKIYQNKVDANDIFISDGAKCDVGRLQILFGSDVTIAVQDPVYPVYVDTSLILRQKGICLMPCTPENDFFPEVLPAVDVIYFCSPNNPTGAVATKDQLARLVKHAEETQAIIIFDAAYASYVQEGIRSIYEIPNADKVAIEMGSFSKMAGFTGLRLGWTVVPEALKFSDGFAVKQDWHRIITTFFNGASRLTSEAGCKALSDKGLKEINETIAFYLENAKIIKEALTESGFTTYGAENIPYLWTKLPGVSSWGLFENFLKKAHLLTVPGSGFGASGEGFLRMSSFGSREEVIESAKRIRAVKNDINSWYNSEYSIQRT